MRVIFLTHYFPPEVGAPQSRIAALAAGLRGRGFEVAVHTPFPHYPRGKVLPPYRQRPWQREQRDGVMVVRSPVYATPNRGTVRRLANHLSFAASSMATAPLAGRADAVVVESPPLFLAGSAIAYAWAKRAALVVNVADRWPASAVELGALREGRALRAAERLERSIYRHAAAITMPTQGIADAVDALPEGRGKAARIAPAVDLGRFAAEPPADRDGPLRVVYAGTLGLAQGVADLVEAARLAGPDEVHVTIAGAGAEEEAVRAAAEGLQHVELVGIVGEERVAELLAEADVGAVLLRDRPLFRAALPTKMLELFAAGRPVVLAGAGEAAALVERSGSGVVVAPEDPAALARALVELRRDPQRRLEMGRAARVLAEHEFPRSRQLDEWEARLRGLEGRER